MQRQALSRSAQGRHLNFHARHINTNRAFAPAGLAGHAQLHGLRHLVTNQGVRSHLAGQRQTQAVRPAARHIPFITGGTIGRTHHTSLELAAGTVVVAHLDSALQATRLSRKGPPAQLRGKIINMIGRRKAKQLAVIHFRRIDNFSRIEQIVRIKHRLYLPEQARQHRPEHYVIEFGAHDAITMFARV